MATIFNGRYTAKIEQPFVVFLIGMRINKLWRINKWLKMDAFRIVGLLSIDPTIRYLRWNKTLKEGKLPEIPGREYKRTRLILSLEVIGLAVILFGAAMIACGIGMSS